MDVIDTMKLDNQRITSDLEHLIVGGVMDKELQLHYQAQFDFAGNVCGFEALLRWEHPLLGLLPAATFFPIAEEAGFALPLSRWAFNAACKQLASWSKGVETRGLMMGVNISEAQFGEEDFVEKITSVANQWGVRASRLMLEIPENIILDAPEDVRIKMKTLSENGFGFALNDYGSGYFNALHYYGKLPMDEFKTDVSYLPDVAVTRENECIAIEIILSQCLELGIDVVVPKIQTAKQFNSIQKVVKKSNACPKFQGNFFGPAVPASEISTAVNRHFSDPTNDV